MGESGKWGKELVGVGRSDLSYVGMGRSGKKWEGVE